MRALSGLYKTEIKLIMAGRTDTEVHAGHQAAHFFANPVVPVDVIGRQLNKMLPNDIRITAVTCVESGFHARFSAKAREYHYCFSAQEVPVLMRHCVASIDFEPNLEVLNKVAKVFVGRKNFRNFSNRGSAESSWIRDVYDCCIEKQTFVESVSGVSFPVYRLKIIANAFLYRMVRCIVGAIWCTVQGKVSEQEIVQAFEDGAKKPIYVLAPPNGLTLAKIYYEEFTR